MQELLELQTGQVAFLSGLLAGFSLTVAANVVQLDMKRIMPRVCLILLMVSTLLFLIALYVDVRLTIELAGIDTLPGAVRDSVSQLRLIGTFSATLALLVFIAAIGSLGWVAGRTTGICSTILAVCTVLVLAFVWLRVRDVQQALPG